MQQHNPDREHDHEYQYEHEHTHGEKAPECCEVPELQRLNYFFGQMLGVEDFRSEQNYFREKQKLHNRCLHGYGTVCGLRVEPAPPQQHCESGIDGKREEIRKRMEELRSQIDENRDWPPEQIDRIWQEMEAQSRYLEQQPKPCPVEPISPRVEVDCGIALDCEGNEIIVRRRESVDLWRLLSLEDRKLLEESPRDLFLSICFCDKPVAPVRPQAADACEPRCESVNGRWQDSWRLQASLHAPHRDARCEACCSCCEERCLLLARIRDVRADGNVHREQIDNHVRRRIGPYDSTRIVGTNWTHGADYWIEEADDLLGGQYSGEEEHGGLVFQTSHPVRADSLQPGVVDVWVVRGGDGPDSEVYNLKTRIIPDAHDRDGLVRRFRVQYLGDELLDNGDRVIVQVRGAFILDYCCEPLDGVNVGGMVPMLGDEEYRRFRKESKLPHCHRDPYGPPRSGVGVPGGSTFESWFWVRRRQEDGGVRHRRHYQEATGNQGA